jgi:homogentisate 1,2-dioxygenase
LYDYHPKAIPALQSSNVDSDEVLYYVDGDGRNNIEQGHITLHPKEFTALHLEQWSIGHTATEEYMVMVDTFRTLMVTEEANDDGQL